MSSTSNKIVIPGSRFPPVDQEFDAYFLRYRIVSEDKNSFSAWSPICEIPTYAVANNEYFATGDGKLSYIYNSKQISASWPLIQNVAEYDVWYKWKLETPEYVSSTWKELSRAEIDATNGNVMFTTVNAHNFNVGDIITTTGMNVWYNLEDNIIISIPEDNKFIINIPMYNGSTLVPYVGSGYAYVENWIYKGRVSGNKLDFYQGEYTYFDEQTFSIRVYVPHNPISHNDDYLIFARLNYPSQYAV
jgi:hypothetical protein